MDRKKVMSDYIDFCNTKREEALKEYSRYNGFHSVAFEVKESGMLNFMQMGVMAEYTKTTAKFWAEKYENAIKEYEKLIEHNSC